MTAIRVWCARGQRPGTRRARVFSALGPDSDPRPAPRSENLAAASGATTSWARRRHPAAFPAEVRRTRAPGGSRSGRCAGGHRAARCQEDDAGVEGRSLVASLTNRTDRPGSVERAPRLSSVPRTGRARVPLGAGRAQCSCSRHNVENMLRSFPQEDRDDMVEDGRITVTCEFCSSVYRFQPDEIVPPPPDMPDDIGHRPSLTGHAARSDASSGQTPAGEENREISMSTFALRLAAAAALLAGTATGLSPRARSFSSIRTSPLPSP